MDLVLELTSYCFTERNPRLPNVKCKVTSKALWIDGLSTLAWVKERLKSRTRGKLEFHVDYGARDSPDTAHLRRQEFQGENEYVCKSCKWMELEYG
ncbi:hypothetical protein M758_7G128700 [Ceratodon purpureus]|nr:hypothetical protein M758_7G128700 [Ceratodon purpureus]